MASASRERRALLAQILREKAGIGPLRYPLSYGQRALWFLRQLAPDSLAYNIAGAVRLTGNLDVAALRRTLHKLVRRHPSLRTTFVAEVGEPFQQIHEEIADYYEERDASAWEEESVGNRLAQEANRTFDLERGPLLRMTLFRRTADQSILLLVVHHIVADFWSLALMVHEMQILYSAERAATVALLPPPQTEYSDYVHWQKARLASGEGERLWSYWQKQLSGELPVLELPTDHPRPPVQTYRGAQIPFHVNAHLTQQLKAIGRAHGATLYMMLLAAFQTLLYRYTGQTEILVGSPTAGRSRAEFERVIGYFANPVVLRADFSARPSFVELLIQVRETVMTALEHQDYPFALLVEQLQPQRDPSRSPLVQAMFVMEKGHLAGQRELGSFVLGNAGERMCFDGLPMEFIPVNQLAAQFDVLLEIAESSAEGLTGLLQFNSDLFEQATIRRMTTHFECLLEGIVANPRLPVGRLTIVPEPESHKLLVEWNGTQQPDFQPESYHQLFESQVERTPHSTAVRCQRERLTYATLNQRANSLARILAKQGIEKEALVAILSERNIDLLTAILAVFKAGGAYIPLNPGHPSERWADVVEQSGCRLVLFGRKFKDELTSSLADRPIEKSMMLEIEDALKLNESRENLGIVVEPRSLAYVIFTSGSTGKPKGVMIEHAGMVNHLYAKISDLELTVADVVAQNASQCFDISVWQYLAALLVGGQVHIIREEEAQNPRLLLEEVDRERLTILEVVPSMLRALLEETTETEGDPYPLPTLRWLIPTGEALPSELCRQWRRRYPGIPMMNTYGATETSDDACHAFIVETPATEELEIAALGRPVGNMRVYVLDQEGQPVPIGVIGELYIGGSGVGRGYLGREELTAERFVPDTFGKVPGSRLYRTGDLARYLSDGRLQFIGRTDHQVKVQGFRVELGEVEGTLTGHPAIKQAVVLAEENGMGNKLLSAYVVMEEGAAESTSGLRSYMERKLPGYMVPSSIMSLKSFPLTGNGKIDRKVLAALFRERLKLSKGFVVPNTPIEELLAEIWAKVLGLDRVGIDDNFFDLGGHSLLATQVISRIRESFRLELSVRNLFESPTVSSLASVIETAMKSGPAVKLPPIVPVPRSQKLPVSFGQQRLWFVDQLQPGHSGYNAPAAFQASGQLNVPALERTLSELLRRHEALRTRFEAFDGQPLQVIDPAQPVQLEVVDLSALPEEAREREAGRLVLEEARRPFDLAKGPLMRAGVVRLAPEEHVLLFTVHHIISDGWSMGVLIREVVTLYEAYCNGQESPLEELRIQYADYAYWQRQWLRGGALEEELRYWKGKLAGAPAVLELPTDRRRPVHLAFEGATQSTIFGPELLDTLRDLCRREQVTLFMLLLAAFDVLLYRYSGQDDIVVGTPIANRHHSETEGIFGFFVNTLVLRTQLSGDLGFAELLSRVRELVLEAHAHQDMPFEKLVEALEPERTLNQSPIFQVMFILQNTPKESLVLPGLTLKRLPVDSGMAKFDLTLIMEEQPEGLEVTAQYNSHLFDRESICRLLRHFETLLQSVVTWPDVPIAKAPISTDDEAQLLIRLFNESVEDLSVSDSSHFKAQ